MEGAEGQVTLHVFGQVGAKHSWKKKRDPEALFSNHSSDDTALLSLNKTERQLCLFLLTENFLIHWFPHIFWGFVSAVTENAYKTREETGINADAESAEECVTHHR